MNKSVFSMLAATALVGVVAVPAHATGAGDQGEASASVLRTNLNIGLLDKTEVPFAVAVNEVKAPGKSGGSEEKTTLTAKLDGVGHGKPFPVLRADVASAKAKAHEHKAAAHVRLAHAKVYVPGKPLHPVVELEKVTSQAFCPAGEQPKAEANVLGWVKLLGKKVKLTAAGTTTVEVPEVGKVRLDLSKTHTTSRTSAASALILSVSVKPLALNVADVAGKITLAEAKCRTPHGQKENGAESGSKGENGTDHKDGHNSGESGKTSGTEGTGGTAGNGETAGTGTAAQPEKAAAGLKAAEAGNARSEETEKTEGKTDQTEAASGDLAATGSSSATPYIAGGAALLVGLGGLLMLARRRKS
ncbi:SCO1860 family LAETG-anchored protein [Streptomyces gobiensis]|uniref:SCO1860 family LAETG-anchored protein n=1 Tax=Streptomyces gobiensis TaxID=2875706 RepID=UPI001E4894F5|nr:SCO1860 family LAETG-anchored protein [Streptomyces gobiensis]UGY90687.1 LPXTG cell wall anchor domain-containing protein [Streptomyces gobiensis]